MHVFAMVTTRHSNAYTDHALSSLVEHTRLERGDRLILIDNDRAYTTLPEKCRGVVEVRENPAPKSFAANVNQMIDAAGAQKADLVFLNNDLIFSQGWFEPLRDGGPFLASPISNAELPYKRKKLDLRYDTDLKDYLENEEDFREIVREHRKRYQGHLKVISFTFFAVKIPYEVFSLLGPLDESFGIGGGEDKDYCIRCHAKGIELRYALQSYLLHFHGRSTWRGGESAEQTAARDRGYIERFKQKWGQHLFDLFVFNEPKNLPEAARLAYEQGNYKRLVELLTR